MSATASIKQQVWYKWARIFFTGSCIIGTGVILFNTTVPTDEELIARFSPEVRASYEHNKALRRKEQEELMKIVKETAASNNPVWMTGSIASPFEKETRGLDPKLVDKELFHRQRAEDFKRLEVEQASKDLEEAELLAKSSKKSWWSWK